MLHVILAEGQALSLRWCCTDSETILYCKHASQVAQVRSMAVWQFKGKICGFVMLWRTFCSTRPLGGMCDRKSIACCYISLIQICAKVHWSCRGTLGLPYISLTHFMLFIPLICHMFVCMCFESLSLFLPSFEFKSHVFSEKCVFEVWTVVVVWKECRKMTGLLVY